MPVYEYICQKCGERFSLLQSVNCKHEDTKCTKCGSSNVKKLMSSFCCSSGFGGGSSSFPSGESSGGG